MLSLRNHYRIASAFGRSLPEFCQRYGVNLAGMDEMFGLDAASFSVADEFISMLDFSNLLEHLARITGDDSFGLKYGMDFTLGDTGAFGFGLMHAPTFEDALKFCVRYASLKADFIHFEATVAKKSVEIEWSYSPLIAPTTQIADLKVALGLRQLRHFTGPGWKPSYAELQRPKPASIGDHLRHITPNLRFSARRNVLQFSADCLRSENPHADPRLFTIMDGLCHTAKQRQAVAEDLVLKVRKVLMLRLSEGGVGLSKIARQLGISDRNLQRRLAEAKLSFEKLLEETRRELSDLLLMTTDLPLTEIGRRLGYASPNTYSRAARKWYGQTAKDIRARHLLERHLEFRAAR